MKLSKDTKFVLVVTLATFLVTAAFWGIWAVFAGSVPVQESLLWKIDEENQIILRIYRGWDLATFPTLAFLATTLCVVTTKHKRGFGVIKLGAHGESPAQFFIDTPIEDVTGLLAKALLFVIFIAIPSGCLFGGLVGLAPVLVIWAVLGAIYGTGVVIHKTFQILQEEAPNLKIGGEKVA